MHMHKKFIEIPELVAILSQYLRPPDLLTCVQVSLQWNKAFIPHLWYIIDDDTLSWRSILWQCGDPAARLLLSSCTVKYQEKDSDKNKGREWLHHIFHKYGRFIRDLTVHWPMVLEAASMASLSENSSGRLTLRSLTVYLKGGQPRRPPPGFRPSQPHLQEKAPPIVISAPLFPGFFEQEDFIQPQLFEPTLLDQIQSLEAGWALTQHYWYLILNQGGLVKLNLGDPAPALWEVSGNVSRMDSQTFLKSFFILTPPRSHNPARTCCPQYQLPDPLPALSTTLRTLSLTSTLTTSRLIDLLSLFPNISNLSLGLYIPDFKVHQPPRRYGVQLPSPPPVPVPETLSRDPSIGANLHVLSITAVYEWESLLALLPNLKELTHSQRLTDSLALSLVERCPKLQVIRSHRGRWSPDNRTTNDDYTSAMGVFAHQMLAVNSQLHVLDMIAYVLRVDEMLRRPWVCLGLEQLSCQIRGLARLSEDEESMARRARAPCNIDHQELGGEDEQHAVKKFERCRDQHYGVYDRLASLTRLRYLDLGLENRVPEVDSDDEEYYEDEEKKYIAYEKPPFDTLELSLASGLDRLGVIKNLEVFGFECTNHRIERAELDWMAKSWPKLRLMYGLDKEQQPRMKHDHRRAELREYFQKLRPDVVHDSLFVEEESFLPQVRSS